jgi:16S rRNA (cytosine967-C5)-methyltransferase
MPPELRNPRDIAVQALGDRSGNISARLDRLIAEGELSSDDCGLAREIGFGTLKHRGTLRWVLGGFLRHPRKRLPAPLEDILLAGAYQLIFLDRVPDFAAVNEAAEQARRFHHKRQTGLVNGVLRSISRALSNVRDQPPPVRRAICVAPGRWRQIDRDLFPDPAKQPARHLELAYSLPRELAERWLGAFGFQQALKLAVHANARPPLVMRVNRLKAAPQDVVEALRTEGHEAGLHANGLSVALAGHPNVRALQVFREGWVQPQDATATKVVLRADPRPGQRVLDFCAAPGTKTTHLAERMANRGWIVAADVAEQKLELIRQNCRRLGIDIVRTILAPEAGQLGTEEFDLALVDAPCSNTGVLARRPEARWRFKPDALGKLATDQCFLLAAAAAFVRRGGRVVYSTCSIESQEGPDVVHEVRRRLGGLEVAAEELMLPAGAGDPVQWRDGGYVAVLEKV